MAAEESNKGLKIIGKIALPDVPRPVRTCGGCGKKDRWLILCNNGQYLCDNCLIQLDDEEDY